MSNESSGAPRVVQMIACNGTWHVVMRAVGDRRDKYASKWFKEPVVCWLLVEIDGTQEIHPAAVLGAEVVDATTAANYICVVTKPGDKDIMDILHKIDPELVAIG
jgi:hypothetical protein